MQRTTFRSVTVAGALVAMIAAGAPAATATEDPVEATAELIAEVAPDQGEVLTGALGDEAVVTDAGGTEVAIPLDPAQPITLDGTTTDAPVLAVHLPTEVNVKKAEVADDGTVVYEAADDGATAAVQTLADGSVRLQTLTPDADGPHEFTYTFGNDITPAQDEDGGIVLTQDFDGGTITFGTVDDAWAIDANGNPVQTTYRIEDDALIQEITPAADTNYPIVADPTISFGWRVYVKYNKAETKSIANNPLTSKAKYAAAVCGIIPNGIIASGCGLVTYDIISSVASTFKSGAKVGKCVQMGYIPAPAYPVGSVPALVSWNVVTC